MLFGFFLTLGVAVLSVALRSFQSSFAQKSGALGILVASFLLVYFATGSWLLGTAGALSSMDRNLDAHPRLAIAKGEAVAPEKRAIVRGLSEFKRHHPRN